MIHQKAQTVCAQLIKQVDGYFGPVFQAVLLEYLSFVEDRLTALQQRQPGLRWNTEALLLSLGRSLWENLINLCSRSFLGELFYAKEHLVGNTPEARYQCFLREHLLPRKEELLSPETELGKLVANRVAFSLAAVTELLERLQNDLEVLGPFLGAPVSSIDDCKLSQGDTHNCGRAVAILTVNGNQKLVYKPHSVENDLIFSGLTQWLNQTGKLTAPLRHLRSLTRDGYGWQEFIPHRPCADTEEAKRYMYRLGAVVFLVYLTACCDLHYENLIACGDCPVLVDTETLFCNKHYLGGYHMETVDPLERFFMHSIFSSGMIPAGLLPGKTWEQNGDGGILHGFNDKEPNTIHAIVRPGTDEMGFGEVSCPPKARLHPNLPYLADSPLHAGDYWEVLSNGFRDAYDVALTHKQELLDMAHAGFFAKGVYRQLFRNTDLYGKYLLASYHPSYLGGKEGRMAVFAKLRGRGDYLSDAHRLLVQSEIQQLLRDDVPYFYTTFSSRALFSCEGCVAEEFYQKSIADDYEVTVQNLNPEDRYRQLYFLERALLRVDGQTIRYYPIDSSVFQTETPADQMASLVDWIIALRERYFRIPSEGAEYAMYLANALGKNGVMLQPEPAILYSGIGSTLFYYQYAAVRGREHALFDAIFRAMTHPDSPLQTPALLGGANYRIGAFDGNSSTLYLYLYLYGASKESKYLRSAENLCEQLIPFAKENRIAWDVIGGHAGTVIFCLNAWKKLPAFSGLRTLAEVCGERLYEAYCDGKIEEQTGFAHGYAGISTAFLMLSSVTGREDYYEAGMDLIRKESAKYNPALKGWETTDGHRSGMNAWCYGGPGILVARELARPSVKEADLALLEHDIAIALQCTKDTVTAGDIRPVLCHGLPGNLSVLQWYAKRTGDSSAYQTAAQGQARLLQLLRERGILMKDATLSLQISFMDGLSGLGYCLLQQLQPEIPCVLALEIP